MLHALLLSAMLSPAHAEPEETAEDEVVVTTEKTAHAAAQVTLDEEALRTTPARDVDDWLRALPGLHVSRHGGRGKAPQILLRGFDADHGADLSVSVAGFSVNEPSHVHGHGYADVSFVPRSLVHRITLTPGSASASVGDFGIAGHVEYDLGLSQRGWMLRLGGGTDRSGTGFVGWRPKKGGPGSFLMADVDAGLGVTEGRDWRHLRIGGGLEGKLGERLTGRLLLLGHDGRYSSPGAVREELLDEVGFYGGVGHPDRGETRRVLLGGRLDGHGERSAWTTGLTTTLRDFQLDSNGTGFLYDAEHGDRTRQSHSSISLMADASASQGFDVGNTPWTVRGGGSIRSDFSQRDITALHDDDVERHTTEDLGLQHLDMAGWTELTARPHESVEATVGLRAGAWRVSSRAEDDPVATVGWTPFLLPKTRVVLSPHYALDVMASWGRGQRSPDADSLSPGLSSTAVSDTAELGLIAHPAWWLDINATAFGTWLGEERIFDHASSRFLASGASRRLGVQASIALEPLPWLTIGGDITYTDARMTETGARVPYAPPIVAGSRITMTGLQAGPVSLDAGLHVWALGARPLTDGFVERTSFGGRLVAGAEWTSWRFDLGIDNLFGQRVADGVFVHPSRPTADSPKSLLPARHVSAGEPLAATLSVLKRF